MNKRKVAIIGIGKIADYHINAIEKSDELELVGGFDIAGDPQDKLKGRKLYSSADELLADPEIETVIILVPVQYKYELSLKVIEAGKNIVTEKPAANNNVELNDLIEKAEQKGVILQGAFHSRFSPTAQEVARLLQTDYAEDEIESIEIWADSPHIVEDQIVGKSSERTSFTAEGPNILAELLLYINNLKIDTAIADSSFQSKNLPEVETRINGHSGNILVRGITSWVRGIKEKGVRIVFQSGRELRAVHTEQKIYNERQEVVFDNGNDNRMQKEYDALYAELPRVLSGEIETSGELLQKVARIMDLVQAIAVKFDRGSFPKEGESDKIK